MHDMTAMNKPMILEWNLSFQRDGLKKRIKEKKT